MEPSDEFTDPRRISRREWFGISFVVACALMAFVIWWPSESFRESVKLRDVIDSLAKRRPSDMEPGQWKIAVWWTSNLDGNSLTYRVDASSIRSLREQLERRLEGDVNMVTIEWIWDSYADLCPSGKRYQRFRKQMLNEIAAEGMRTVD